MTNTNLNPNSPFFHEDRHNLALRQFTDKAITICGAGAIGGNLAETLARMGFSRLKLIDKDRVETRNLSTQPYLRPEVGSAKARALANTLYRAVQAKVESVVTELTTDNANALLKNSDLVVDAFDNRNSRLAVSAAALDLKTACLHIGFSGNGLYGSGLWEPGYALTADEKGESSDPCDYPLTRPLALMLASVAARTISDFWTSGQAFDFELTWHDLKINRFLKE